MMQLLDHFSELTIYPENAKKLRELVLQLAVQGKLTASWRTRHPELVSGSNSAETLLEKIKTEKNRLIRDGKIRKEQPLLPIKEDEIPYELPVGWVWCRLGEYIHNLGQKQPDETFTYIDVGSINKEKGKISDELSILKPNEAPSRARKIIKSGCVIYSTVRP
jgi:type I restriction enzyme S subunit